MSVYTLLNNVQATGPGSALDCANAQKAGFFIAGDFEGEIVFEITPDNTNWYVYDGRLIGGQRVDRILAPNRVVYFDVEIARAIRPRITRITKGSVTVYGYTEATKAQPVQWSITQDSAANTAQTLTKAGVAGTSHCITGFDVSISGAAAGNAITIQLQDGATTVFKTSIPSGAAVGTSKQVFFTFPVQLTPGNAANLAVGAGGTGCITTANLIGYTQ